MTPVLSDLLSSARLSVPHAPVVKICGLKTRDHARTAVDAGAAMVGLVFAPSKRRVTLEEARAIVGEPYDRRPLFVGVFANASPGEVMDTARAVGLDLVQFSGAETPEDCAVLTIPYSKVIHLHDDTTSEDVLHIANQYSDAGYILLDRAGAPGSLTAWGGGGAPTDWRLAAEVVRRLDRPVMLAGGLRPETVAAAVAMTTPWGVDVSSGVETDGVKDEQKMAAFVAAARSEERR